MVEISFDLAESNLFTFIKPTQSICYNFNESSNKYFIDATGPLLRGLPWLKMPHWAIVVAFSPHILLPKLQVYYEILISLIWYNILNNIYYNL